MILYDETIRQNALDGTPFPELLASKGIIPGIKVDEGAKPLALAQGETVTEGLDGLRARLEEYRGLGARFAKWRATYSITDELPSDTASGRTRTRSPATRRSARRPGSCRSSSRRCSRTARTRSSAASRSRRACSQAVYTELLRPARRRGRHAAEAQHGAVGLRGVEPRRRRRGRRAKPARLLQARAWRRARDRVPLRRPVGRGRDRAPQRDERERPAPVAAVVLVRARAAGGRAEGVGGQARERRGRPARLLPPREDELAPRARACTRPRWKRARRRWSRRKALGSSVYSNPVSAESFVERCCATIAARCRIASASRSSR